MPRTLVTSLCVSLLTVVAMPAARANDIEDFFKALRGSGSRSQSDRHHEADHGPTRIANGGHGRHLLAGSDHAHRHSTSTIRTGRDDYKAHQHAHENLRPHYGSDFGSDRSGYDLSHRHDHTRGHMLPGSALDRSLSDSRSSAARLSLRLNLGSGNVGIGSVRQPSSSYYAPRSHRPVPAVPEIPSGPAVMHLPHQIGEIVDCAVPLSPYVVEDVEKIAPNAVPVVVAVRDPNLPPHVEGCVHNVVFVEVYVPACPMRSLTISPCKTRIRLDFGLYEVDIRSADGVIRVDYDN